MSLGGPEGPLGPGSPVSPRRRPVVRPRGPGPRGPATLGGPSLVGDGRYGCRVVPSPRRVDTPPVSGERHDTPGRPSLGRCTPPGSRGTPGPSVSLRPAPGRPRLRTRAREQLTCRGSQQGPLLAAGPGVGVLEEGVEGCRPGVGRPGG